MTALLRLPDVMRRVPFSRSEIYRRIAAGDFPRPVPLGERARAWSEHEVMAWCEARIAARDAGLVAPNASRPCTAEAADIERTQHGGRNRRATA